MTFGEKGGFKYKNDEIIKKIYKFLPIEKNLSMDKIEEFIIREDRKKRKF